MQIKTGKALITLSQRDSTYTKTHTQKNACLASIATQGSTVQSNCVYVNTTAAKKIVVKQQKQKKKKREPAYGCRAIK